MMIEDLIAVERALGFSYEMAGGAGHYQHICPRCRRVLVGLAQGGAWIGPAPAGGPTANR
jgi:hypothetical protein